MKRETRVQANNPAVWHLFLITSPLVVQSMLRKITILWPEWYHFNFPSNVYQIQIWNIVNCNSICIEQPHTIRVVTPRLLHFHKFRHYFCFYSFFLDFYSLGKRIMSLWIRTNPSVIVCWCNDSFKRHRRTNIYTDSVAYRWYFIFFWMDRKQRDWIQFANSKIAVTCVMHFSFHSTICRLDTICMQLDYIRCGTEQKMFAIQRSRWQRNVSTRNHVSRVTSVCSARLVTMQTLLSSKTTIVMKESTWPLHPRTRL